MKISIRKIIQSKHLFIYLLPVFFVLHGYTENFDFVPVKDALLLLSLYLGCSLLITLIFRVFYRNFTKAGLVAFLIMAFYFFFGSVHDGLKKIFPGSFVTKYSSILPVLFIFFAVIIILLRKRKKPLLKITSYLNVLLLLLVMMDSVRLITRLFNKNRDEVELPKGFSVCPDCRKPDIYFILADEYAGNTELKNIFNFDDSIFLNELLNRGFHTVTDSYSNYNYTPFSLASILSMNYLKLEGNQRSKHDLSYCYETIRDNDFLKFLRYHGYTFYNYSVFDFKGQPARVRENFLPAKTRLITSQTFLNRIDRDLRFNLITRFKSKKAIEREIYSNKENNENIFRLTIKITNEKINKPKFVYTHLMMPHYPYYFDKNGKEMSFEKLTEGNQVNQQAYIEYLQYANKRLLALIDHIQQASVNPPIIILMGDHGFRHFTRPVESKYYFLNLMSVYLPSKNYAAFHDSLSCVNFFRSFLNTEFNQHLPYLKDSTIYLNDD